MQIAEVQFMPWDSAYWFDPADFDVKVGDKVIVKTELGLELGKVVGLRDVPEEKLQDKELKPIMRRANLSDEEKVKTRSEQKDQVIEACRELFERKDSLKEMKIADIHFSYDGGRMTIAYIAPGRIDFRELVKDLTHRFQKSVRMHQLGVRDEAKLMGQMGGCGRGLCCRGHLKELGQVTMDYAEDQQVAHRGSERLSGVCGRLKCCLKYEESYYQELVKNMPAVDSPIKTPQGHGSVVSWNVLKQTVNVRLDADKSTIVEVEIK